MVRWWTLMISRSCVKVKGQGHHAKNVIFKHFTGCMALRLEVTWAKVKVTRFKVKGLGRRSKVNVTMCKKTCFTYLLNRRTQISRSKVM